MRLIASLQLYTIKQNYDIYTGTVKENTPHNMIRVSLKFPVAVSILCTTSECDKTRSLEYPLSVFLIQILLSHSCRSARTSCACSPDSFVAFLSCS